MQWENAIKCAINDNDNDEIVQILKDMLAMNGDAPRKEKRFMNYVQGRLRINNNDLLHNVWNAINKADADLHQLKFEDIPAHLVSVADVARHINGGPVWSVHRLDMETSGILMLAKTEESCAELCKQFRERTIKKKYLAEVAGCVKPELSVINFRLRPDKNNRPWQVVDNENGKDAQTLIRIKDIDHQRSTDTTLVELEPITGRTHQLRVHLASSDHPILGDTLYANEEIKNKSKYLRLHAQFLEFDHPVSGERVQIESKSCGFL